jgi:hypothetical protein
MLGNSASTHELGLQIKEIRMKYQVPDSVIKQTTKCEHNFSCLETGKCGDKPMCKVDYADGDNVTFLQDKEDAFCSYRVPFGFSQVCTCPTHYAIQQQA